MCWGRIWCGTLRWRHNGRNGVSNHQPHDCLFNRLFRRKSKKTSKPRVTGLCEGNSSVIGEFPAQRASKADNVSTWWRHHVPVCCSTILKYNSTLSDARFLGISPAFLNDVIFWQTIMRTNGDTDQWHKTASPTKSYWVMEVTNTVWFTLYVIVPT